MSNNIIKLEIAYHSIFIAKKINVKNKNTK